MHAQNFSRNTLKVATAQTKAEQSYPTKQSPYYQTRTDIVGNQVRTP